MARNTVEGRLGGGAYSVGATTGIIAAGLGADQELFQWRWSSTTLACRIRRIRVSASVSTTAFGAGVPLILHLIKATGFTGISGGGTTLDIQATLKRNTDFPSSSVAAIRVASTAGVGAGTKNLEANVLATLVAHGPTDIAAMSGQMIPPGTILWECSDEHESPLTLVANEGFCIRADVTPGTGTWTAGFNVDWSEYPL